VHPNPAIEEFARRMGARLIWGDILIRKVEDGFELRHRRDEASEASALRGTTLAELQDLAGKTIAGRFRPLKSAPNLGDGWVLEARSTEELWRALNVLYPGAVADWHATLDPGFCAIAFQEFAGRQSGMYRIAASLELAQARQVARATCHTRFCLKQRWWTTEPEEQASKPQEMAIPCLDPCSFLLEAARKAARTAQEPPLGLQLAPSELELMLAAVEKRVETGVEDPLVDSRRLQLLLAKYRPVLEAAPRVAQKE
jgi:4Fe-4S iron-sulfur cluster binding domain/DR2241 stabilising domain